MVAHCAEDAWTDSAGSRQLYKQSKTPESDKVLHLLPGRTHTLTKGEVGAEVLGKVLDWLRARTPGKA
jgi:alpha-beta hydrolase superfamily lysophospholipase